MSPRPDVSEKRKHQIIEAATTVFARLGFNQARMVDIAEEAGLSKGTIYWYFKGKDEIISAILENMLKREVSQMDNALNNGLPAKENLQQFTECVVEDILRLKPLIPILFEFWALLTRRKSVQQTINKFYQAYMEVITPIIQHGINRGEFRSVSAENVAIAIGSIFEGTILLWSYAPEIVDIEEHTHSSVDLLIEGLAVKI